MTREQDKPQGHWLDLKLPPVLLLLLVMGLMVGMASFASGGQRFAYLAALSGQLLWVHQVVVGMLVLVAVVIAFAGVFEFRRAKTTVDPTNPSKASSIVDSGIFARTRNPMYLGMTVFLVAWAMVLGNWVAFLGVPLFIEYMTRFQIMPEERILTQQFGRAYQDYYQRVNRWFGKRAG